MRIGHYAPSLWTPGGIASYVRRLGRAQTGRGYEVVYLSRHDTSRPEGVTAHTVHNGSHLFDQARSMNLDMLHLHRPAPTLPETEHRLATVRTMHGNQGSCPSGSRYLKRTGTPCNRAYTVSGCLWGHFVDHCGSRRPHKTLSNFVNIQQEHRQAALFPTLTVSQFLKDQMIRSGCPSHNLRVIHSPAPSIPEDSFTPPPQAAAPPRFVFAGRIEPKKGVDWLLRATAKVQTALHVDIAGSGDTAYLDRLHDLIDDLGIEDRITLHGWLDENEVYALIRQARAVVFPSVWHEPAGLVTLEAAALGRPIIASAVGGIPEYAHPDFAKLVSPRDINGLAAAIDQLATHPEKAARMGREGREHAQTTFSMEQFIDRLHAVYDRVRANTPSPRAA